MWGKNVVPWDLLGARCWWTLPAWFFLPKPAHVPLWLGCSWCSEEARDGGTPRPSPSAHTRVCHHTPSWLLLLAWWQCDIKGLAPSVSWRYGDNTLMSPCRLGAAPTPLHPPFPLPFWEPPWRHMRQAQASRLTPALSRLPSTLTNFNCSPISWS